MPEDREVHDGDDQYDDWAGAGEQLLD